MQAELFEAYVAALEHERGYPYMYDWLFQLNAPLVHRLIADAQLRPARPASVASGAASWASPALTALDTYSKQTGINLKLTHQIQHQGAVAINHSVISCGGLTATGSGRTRVMSEHE